MRARKIWASRLRPGDTFTERDANLAGYTVTRIEQLYGGVHLEVMTQDGRGAYLDLPNRYVEIYG